MWGRSIAGRGQAMADSSEKQRRIPKLSEGLYKSFLMNVTFFRHHHGKP
jgi:hypothetical protein